MAARTRRLIWQQSLYLAAVAVFALALLVVVVPGAQDRRRLSPLDVFETGEIRIAVDASNPPFAAVSENGTLFGIEIDLGEALADYLGLPARFINMGFDGLYDSLEGDQAVADIVISQLLINPLRMGDVFYTRPYFNAGLVLVSAAGDPVDHMRGLSGRSLAYEFGSTADSEARRWLRRIDPFATMPYELPTHALDAVRLNEADAALVDIVTARLYLRSHPDWDARISHVTYAPYAIAVNIADVVMWTMVDEALTQLLKRGAVDEIIRRWL